LLGCGFGESFIVHLPLAHHVHQFDAGQDDASTSKILEARHWFDDTFDGPVIVLHDVIQALVLASVDRSALSASSKLAARGKNVNMAVVAVARELAGFIWDISRLATSLAVTRDAQPA
jgi:hypothetical protein